MMTVENQVNEQLWDAAACGDVEAVKAALAAGADVNAVNLNGSTSLLLAAQNNIFMDLSDISVDLDDDFSSMKNPHIEWIMMNVPN